MARDVKSNKKGFHKCIRGKKKTSENMGLLLKGAGVLVTQDMDKAEEPNVFFTSAFASQTRLQESPGARGKCWSKENVPLVEKDQVTENLSKLDICKPHGP